MESLDYAAIKPPLDGFIIYSKAAFSNMIRGKIFIGGNFMLRLNSLHPPLNKS